jgi:hypothetical protein
LNQASHLPSGIHRDFIINYYRANKERKKGASKEGKATAMIADLPGYTKTREPLSQGDLVVVPSELITS